MKHKRLLQPAGFAAFAAVVCGLGFVAILAVVGPGNSPTGVLALLSQLLSFAAILLVLFAVLVLSFDLEAETDRLALTACVIFVASELVGLLIGFMFDPINVPPVPWGVVTLFSGVGLTLFGRLQWHSQSYGAGIGGLALLTGLGFMVAGLVLMLTGDALSLGPFPFVLILCRNGWLLWLGATFLRRQSTRNFLARA